MTFLNFIFKNIDLMEHRNVFHYKQYDETGRQQINTMSWVRVLQYNTASIFPPPLHDTLTQCLAVYAGTENSPLVKIPIRVLHTGRGKQGR